jgi:hypothetical protein
MIQQGYSVLYPPERLSDNYPVTIIGLKDTKK